jgi:hypothetical protein
LRKAFFSPNTVLTFISADDPAITVADEKRADAIAKYARTLDQRVLELAPGVEASRFFVRVLDVEQKAAIQSLVTTDDDLGGFAGALQTEVGRALLRSLIEKNLVGYKNFNLVTGFTDFGEAQIKRFDCEINGPVEKEVRDALLSDVGFTVNLMLFLLTAGQLSDDEKKA